jgi:putative heme-binding domain-containing protein
LCFVRMGKPSANTAQLVAGAVDQLYPSPSEKVNQELCRIAVYFNVPGVIEDTLALVDQTKYHQDQLHYIFTLRNVSEGWTLEQRRRYFSWFNKDLNSIQHPPRTLSWFLEAGRGFSFGASFNKFMVNIKNDALAHLTDSEKNALKDILDGGLTVDRELPPNPILTRGEFTEWTMSDIESQLDQVGKGRDFEQGRLAYQAAQCGACHRFGNEGGSVGPELTAISSRFSRLDVLDSIMHPSKVLSEQYVYEKVQTKNGEQFVGRLVGETDSSLDLQENPYDSTVTTVKKTDISAREPSKLSPMPEGLLQVLKKEEILDLLAYLESGGDRTKPQFSKKP